MKDNKNNIIDLIKSLQQSNEASLKNNSDKARIKYLRENSSAVIEILELSGFSLSKSELDTFLKIIETEIKFKWFPIKLIW